MAYWHWTIRAIAWKYYSNILNVINSHSRGDLSFAVLGVGVAPWDNFCRLSFHGSHPLIGNVTSHNHGADADVACGTSLPSCVSMQGQTDPCRARRFISPFLSFWSALCGDFWLSPGIEGFVLHATSCVNMMRSNPRLIGSPRGSLVLSVNA